MLSLYLGLEQLIYPFSDEWPSVRLPHVLDPSEEALLKLAQRILCFLRTTNRASFALPCWSMS